MGRRLVMDRLNHGSMPEPNSGCWLWIGHINRHGYAQISINARKKQAHRVAYEELIGPIPRGKHLDHLCRCRSCINPQHMEPVDNRTNVLRGLSFAAEKSRQTNCIHGHSLSGANLIITSRGSRQCRACRQIRTSNYRRKRRASFKGV